MNMRRVVVTGVGVNSPFGRDVNGMFEALMAGRSAISFNAIGEEPHGTRIASAVCPDADASQLLGKGRVAALDRISHLAVLAASSAWSDAGLDSLSVEERESTCVMMGTGVGGSQTTEKGYRDLFLRNRSRLSPLTVVQCMNNAPAAHIAQMFGLGGACHTYSVACASAAVAISDAARRIRAGDCDVAVAGGAEAALPYGIVKAWLSMQVLANASESDAANACRPFALDRGGLVLGEGAAILILEEREHALARGARILAEFVGAGSSCDHGHLTAPLAQGQLRALKSALREARANPEDVQYINAHGTATPEGDPVEIDAIRQHFGGHAAHLAISATKSMHGHMMGASGAIEAVITVLAVNRRQVPPTAHRSEIDPACLGVDHVLGSGREVKQLDLALSNSFAFGGSNVVLAFRQAG